MALAQVARGWGVGWGGSSAEGGLEGLEDTVSREEVGLGILGPPGSAQGRAGHQYGWWLVVSWLSSRRGLFLQCPVPKPQLGPPA